MRRLVLVAILVCASGAASRASAQPLGPGSERAVSALLIAGGPLRDGTRITAVRVEERSIVVALRDVSGVALEVWLVPRGAGGVSTLATTPSFDVVGERAAAGVARVLAARVTARDDGGFWTTVPLASASGTATSARDLGWADDARRTLGWLALAALLAVLAVRTARRVRRDARVRRLLVPTLCAAACVLALALTLRVFVTPWAPLHSNEHGVATVRGLVAHGSIGPDESTRYGVAYARIVRPIAALAGGSARAPFAVAALAGAVTALLALVLARALTRSLAAGLVAGVGVALHPMHVRVSGSESMLVLAAALAMLALVGVCYALDTARPHRGRVLAVWITGLATAASLELGWTAPAFAVGVGLFAMVLWRPAALRGLRLHVVGAIAWAALAAGLHALALAGFEPGEPIGAFSREGLSIIGPLRGARSGLDDPTMASQALVPLAVSGSLALLWARRARPFVGLVLFGAVALVTAALVAAARRDVIRYAAGAHLAHFVLASGVVLLVRRRLLRAAVAGAVCLLLLLTSLPGLADVARADAAAMEWAVARRAPAGLRSVVVAPFRLGDKVLSDYPEYLVQPAPRVAFSRTSEAHSCRIWIGMPCWSFAREELVARDGVDVDVDIGVGRMRRECVELLGGNAAARTALARLTPVDVRHRAQELHVIPAAEPRVGYVPCESP